MACPDQDGLTEFSQCGSFVFITDTSRQSAVNPHFLPGFVLKPWRSGLDIHVTIPGDTNE